MLAKINRVKNLGLVFKNFIWSPGTPDFRDVNLIYGWNGCGKTTLTRLFDEMSTPAQAGLEFDVELSDGASINQRSTFPHQVRVFNPSYVQRNVRILESKANTISVLLGEENKELVAKVEALERELYGNPSADPNNIGKIRELEGFTQKKDRKQRGNETAFSDIARTISAAIVGGSSASRTYRSPDAKRDFETLALPSVLSEDDLQQRSLLLKQEQLPTLALLELPLLKIDDAPQEFAAALDAYQKAAQRLCARSVEAETIARLRDNPDIAEWVETGRQLHASHNSAGCEYCGNAMAADRLSQLAGHFSVADAALKADIDRALRELRDAYTGLNSLSTYDAARLYGDLRPAYETEIASFQQAKAKVLAEIETIGKALNNKKTRASESIALSVSIDWSDVTQALSQINRVLSQHNAKSTDFQKIRDDAVREIKAYYLTTIHQDVTRRVAEIKELEPDLERRASEIENIKKSISTAKAAISSTHKACEQINLGLKTFLGHQELTFEPEADADVGEEAAPIGYRIMRGDQPAAYLSEGEKTAIAFVYFVVHLADGQFSKRDGIVVIDDPISSLDSNSLYQAFSFLKNAVIGCHQVFVLTHNFDFLKLLLNWRRHQRNRTGYCMLRNEIIDGERRAKIVEMDKELRDYDSEYQYLFKQLKKMRAEQDGTLMRAYPVPNIARKVWDSFLMYRIPNSENPYRKMDVLKAAGFDAQKLDAVYKYTNDQSHITGAGFDPALVPETQKVLPQLFEMMQEIAPDHFAVLDAATAL